jgi:hypothetical protein
MLTATRNRTIEQLEQVMPGQSVDWYQRISRLIDDGMMPMPMIGPAQVVETYRSPPKPPTTTRPAPEPPKNVVSEATKAYNKRRAEEDENAAEKAKLYSNFGFYS